MNECDTSTEAAAEHAEAKKLNLPCPHCGTDTVETAQPREIINRLTAYTHPETDSGGGNRETWLQGKGKTLDGQTINFRLDAGAGLGNTHLSLLVELDGDPDEAPERVWEYIDVTTLIEEWVNAITEGRTHNPGDLDHDAEAEADDDDCDEHPCTVCGEVTDCAQLRDGRCRDCAIKDDEVEHTDRVTEQAIQDTEAGL